MPNPTPQPLQPTPHRRIVTTCEVVGSLLAMAYAVLIALNIGAELVGFALLLTSASLFGIWAVIERRFAFLALQLFYAGAAIIGLVRWY